MDKNILSINAEDKFRLIFDGSADGILFLDSGTGEILDVNKCTLELFRCEKEYFINKTLDQLEYNSAPYTKDEAVEFLTKSIDTPQKFYWEARRKDGSSFRASVNIHTTKIADKLISVVTVRDMSFRREADDDLLKEKNFTNALLDSIPGLIYMYDSKGNLVRWNKKHEELTGYSSEELSRMTLADWYKGDQETIDYILSRVQVAFREGYADAEAWLQNKDGSKLCYYFTAVKVILDGELYIVGTAINITERKQREESLAKSEAEFRSLFEASPSGAVTIVNRLFHKLSKRFLKIVGYDESELLEKSTKVIYPDEEMYKYVGTHLYKTINENGLGFSEAVLKKKDGTLINVTINANAINPDNLDDGISCVIEDITDKKRKEEALAKSEAEYRSLFETSPTGSVIFRNRHFVKMSHRFLSMIGYSDEELVGKSTRIMYPDEETYNKVGIELYGAIDDTGFGKIETVLKRKDGNCIDVIINANPLNPENHAEGISSVFEDITERKKYEKELIKREAELRSLFEASPTGAAMVVNRVFKKVSSQFCRILGYSAEELLENPVRLAYPSEEEYINAGKDLYQIDPISGVGRTETRLKCKNGHIMDVIISSCPLNPKNLADGVCVVFEDITEKKKKTEELAKRELEYRSLFEASPSGAATIIERRLQKVSKRFCEMVGYSEEELVGSSTRMLYPDDASFEKVGAELYRMIEEHGFGKVETPHIRKNGETIYVVISGCPLNPENISEGFSCTMEDITELKRITEAMEKRLISLTRPLEGANVSFDELFDIDAIQHLQDIFAESFGVASIISRPDGTPITKPSNFTKLCSIIRNTEKGFANCCYSDSVIGRLNPEGPVMQRCLSGALWDGGASITVGGHHVANWLIGQVRDPSWNDENMMKYAVEIGADEAAFREALAKIPVISEERFAVICKALFEIATQISTIAYQNVQQARTIVDLKNTENSLRYFQYSIDKAFDAVFWINKEGLCVYANEQAVISMGYSKEELLRMYVWETNTAFKKELWAEYWESTQAKAGVRYESTHLRKDGTVFPVEVSSSYFDGPIPLRIAIVRDITDRKREEERYKTILQASMDGFAIIDNAGVYVDVNETYLSIFGYSKNELLGKGSELLSVPGESHKIKDYFEIIKRKGSARFETIVKKKSGEIIDVEASIYRLSTADGYYCVFIRDITERKKNEERIKSINIDLENRVQLRTIELEEKSRVLEDSLRKLESAQHQLVVSERMAAIGSLVAGVAHEINTPLGVGVTAASYIETSAINLKNDIDSGLSDREKIKTFVNNMNESASLLMSNLTKAAELVQSFKQVAVDQTSGEKRTFKVREYLESIVQSLHPYTKKFPIQIIIECPDDLIIDSYPGGLSQVMTNLINNSIVHAFPVEREEIIKIRVFSEWETLVIEYSDNGNGISSEIIDRIYDPFFTTKRNEGGSGLGLHIVFKIVTEQMRGKMICESTPGIGTVFSMKFSHKEVGIQKV